MAEVNDSAELLCHCWTEMLAWCLRGAATDHEPPQRHAAEAWRSLNEMVNLMVLRGIANVDAIRALQVALQVVHQPSVLPDQSPLSAYERNLNEILNAALRVVAERNGRDALAPARAEQAEHHLVLLIRHFEIAHAHGRG